MKKRYIISCTALLLTLLLSVGLMIPGFAEGSAPVAENFEFETYRGVSFGGELAAIDPDGDTLTFEITTAPVKGSIELSDDGSFVYTPADGKRGKDYFGYKAVDSDGNRSQEATVIIRLIKQKTEVSYADMDGSASYCAAIRLAECGAFVGRQLGGEYYFDPDATLSRGEFLSLCLEVTGTDTLTGVVSTGFTDDGEIPEWQKSYVSTAVKNGIVKGYSGEDGPCFGSDSVISRAEATAMLNRSLGLSNVSYVNLNDAVPTWAAQDAANLCACNVISPTAALDRPLTRADAADMLAAAMSVIESR